MNGEHDKTAGAAEAGNLLHDLIGLAKAGQQPPLGIPPLTFRERVALIALEKFISESWTGLAPERPSQGHSAIATKVRDLTDAVCAAMEAEPETTAPVPVKVSMRQHTDDMQIARWQCQLAGQWLTCPCAHKTTAAVRMYGDAWLSAFSSRLGVPLEAVWEDNMKEDKT